MSHLLQGKTLFRLFALLIAVDAIAAEPAPDANANTNPNSASNAQRCVQINTIRRTEVVDDQNILFHMRGNKVYNNRLPNRCPGLGLGRAFKYSTSSSQLCNVDIISVIESSTGRIVSGARCGLGMFVPVEPKKKTDAS
jgi:hypothetical protein